MPAGIELPPEGVASFRGQRAGQGEALARALGNGAHGVGQAVVIADYFWHRGRGPGRRARRSSARYAGREGDDRPTTTGCSPSLRALPGEHDRAARFVCVIAFVTGPGTAAELVRGEWPGAIATAPRGVSGFGYDPLSYPAVPCWPWPRWRSRQERPEPPRASGAGAARAPRPVRPVEKPVAVDVHDHALKARAAWASIASNATLIVFKLVVGCCPGSIGIIPEALHSGSTRRVDHLPGGRAGLGQAGRPLAPLRPREGREHLRGDRGPAHHRGGRGHRLRGGPEDRSTDRTSSTSSSPSA